MIKQFNEIDEIYSNGIIKEGNEFVCSVCKKKYKREQNALRHFERKDCHQLKDIFSGTDTEDILYEIYRQLMAVESKPVFGKRRFYGTRYYNSIARFYLHCYHHRVFDLYDYLEYVLLNTKWTNIFQPLTIALKETTLQDYRIVRRKKPNKRLNERFWRQHLEHLGKDPDFTLRALERGEISVSYLFDRIDFDEFVDSLTGAELYRLETFLNDFLE